jgi:non-heme chloroperoxidase
VELVVGHENSGAIQIYYEDHGRGAAVVMVHGYLLDGRSWEKQETALLTAGYRVITDDRRGFGASSRPSVGYDCDTLAADLAELLDALDLREAVLVGFCAGTGEVTRYLGTYRQSRVRAAALLAPLPPFLPRTDDNPDGIDRAVLDEFLREVIADRPAATKTYLDRSYNIDLLGGTQVSDQAWQNSFHVAIGASATGRTRRHRGLAGGLPRRPGPDHRPGPRRTGQPGPDHATRGDRQPATRPDPRRPARRGTRRPVRDHLDPRRPAQPRAPRLPQQPLTPNTRWRGGCSQPAATRAATGWTA